MRAPAVVAAVATLLLPAARAAAQADSTRPATDSARRASAADSTQRARPPDTTRPAARDTTLRPAAPAGTAHWELLVGHSYSSARALMQPATLVLEQERGAPLYSVLDAGALLRGSLQPRTWLEMGLRARAGSARPPTQRAYGAMARLFADLDPILVAAGYEYLADGHFVTSQSAATFELTPLGGAPGLGTWLSPALHFRWRPWLGLSWGRGARPYGRLAAEVAAGRVEAGVEATGWLVEGTGVGFVQGDLSVQMVGGLYLTASGETGRAPPAFEPSGRIGVGLGFRLAAPF